MCLQAIFFCSTKVKVKVAHRDSAFHSTTSGLLLEL